MRVAESINLLGLMWCEVPDKMLKLHDHHHSMLTVAFLIDPPSSYSLKRPTTSLSSPTVWFVELKYGRIVVSWRAHKSRISIVWAVGFHRWQPDLSTLILSMVLNSCVNDLRCRRLCTILRRANSTQESIQIFHWNSSFMEIWNLGFTISVPFSSFELSIIIRDVAQWFN